MPFRFPLESLLRLYRSREHHEQLRLQILVAQRTRLRVEMEEIRQRLYELRRLSAAEAGKILSGAELNLLLSWQQLAQRELGRLQSELADVEQRYRQQLEAYQRARRQRETVESLRARHLHAYQRLENRRQQKTLDELHLLHRSRHGNG